MSLLFTDEIPGSNQFQVLTVPGDINNKEDRATLIERTIEKYGKLDVLVSKQCYFMRNYTI